MQRNIWHYDVEKLENVGCELMKKDILFRMMKQINNSYILSIGYMHFAEVSLFN